MPTQDKQNGSLIFKRALLNGRVTVRTQCDPGQVTVLQDENGSDLPAYESFFYEKPSKERIHIELNQKPVDLAEIIRVGFTEAISPELSIQDYLFSAGYSTTEVADLIAYYELDKVSYLPCAHLPLGPQRIVLLLAALNSSMPAMVLKDPFMPFSGRWREHFAKLLLDNSRERNRVIICTNLSFVPQTWSQGELMHYLDVGHAAEEMRAQYRWEQEAKVREQQERSPKREETPTACVPTALTTQLEPSPSGMAGEGSQSETPHYLNSTYREVRDRIFAPLKEFSDFMRSYSALVITGCMAILIATMGIAFSPNLSLYREKMQALGTNTGATVQAFFSGSPSTDPLAATAPSTVAEHHEEAKTESASAPPAAQLMNPDYELVLPEVLNTTPVREDINLLGALVENTLMDESGSLFCQ